MNKSFLLLLLLISLAGCVNQGKPKLKTGFTDFLESNVGSYLKLEGFFTKFNPYGADVCSNISYFFYTNCSALGFACGKYKFRQEAYLPVSGKINPKIGEEMHIRAKISKRKITCIDYYIEKQFPFKRAGKRIIFEDFVIELDDKYCESDSDCGCGTKIGTGECFVGNKIFVNTTKQCPDFCSGIAGNFKVACINNECKLTRKA